MESLQQVRQPGTKNQCSPSGNEYKKEVESRVRICPGSPVTMLLEDSQGRWEPLKHFHEVPGPEGRLVSAQWDFKHKERFERFAKHFPSRGRS